MHRFLWVFSLFFLLTASVSPDKCETRMQHAGDPLPAFPGAEGFGRFATGGRGGRVIYVTNLNDSGPGSLRAAVEATGPRYILFQVAGNIDLQSNINILNGDVTIAGQTAPGAGICLRHYSVVLQADNIIIRFLRFRMGDEGHQQADALESRSHKNIIVDHCSMSWSTDECVSIYNNENTTLQWCIISESLNNSVHQKGQHGYGGIWGGKNATFHHNLLAHNKSRNPRLGERAGDIFALTDLVDLRNNVIYNWQINSCYGGEAMNVNIVNCYYKPGPATAGYARERIVAIDKNKVAGKAVFDLWGKFHVSGNYVDGSERATSDNWTYGVYNQFTASYGTLPETVKSAMRLEEEHPVGGNVYTHNAQQAYEKVLACSGASFVRDAIDERVIDNVRKGEYHAKGSKGSKNGIIDSQNDVGGWPVLSAGTPLSYSSGDGMPDAWKIEHKLDPKQSQTNGHQLSPEYDNVEVYMNDLVKHIISQQR